VQHYDLQQVPWMQGLESILHLQGSRMHLGLREVLGVHRQVQYFNGNTRFHHGLQEYQKFANMEEMLWVQNQNYYHLHWILQMVCGSSGSQVLQQ